MLLQSFSAVLSPDVQVLILGTMPGGESQRVQQYYAHPRNAFWPLMENLFGINKSAPYPQRLQALNKAGVGLWDVFAECERKGSLDSAINQQQAQHNDIASLLLQYPAIHSVFFNGRLAQQIFQRHCVPQLAANRVAMQLLPSSSPANAALRFEQKLAAWQAVKEAIHG